MAEGDAEIALLHKLQAGQENVAWEKNDTNGAAESDLPSNTENNNEQDKKETVADDQVLRAFSPSVSVAVSDEGEYDPSSVTSIPAVTIAGQDESSRSSSRASTRKPKTVGGFIADDSDEEYDASTPTITTSLQLSAANTPNRALAPSPLQNSISQKDLQAPTENQDSSSVAALSNALSVNPSAGAVTPSVQETAKVLASKAQSTHVQGTSVPKARLPHDKVGMLEDRIKEDPRGELDGWLSLIDEHRSRNRLDDARAVYERFLKLFPQAAEVWVAYTQMEMELDNFEAAEQIFTKSLLTVPNVDLFTAYLNYVRRRNDLTNDATGNARTTVSDAYSFVLDTIGIDRESGKIWQDYIQFLKGIPGQLGGTTWQDQQKMDVLRKAYQRAVCIPMTTVTTLWKEYDQFEMTLNKMTGRKFIQERSPAYMTARSANTALENIISGLLRTTLPRLPPAHGFQGDEEYMYQVGLWKKWIAWEKEDPLVLKADEIDLYKKRVLYVYKQAMMAMRFWPGLWVDAAEWCFSNGFEKEGDDFLNSGIAANPESCLVSFKKADRIESTLATDNASEREASVRAPFKSLLDTLYNLIKELKVREAKDIAKLEESTAVDATISAIISKAEDDDEDDEEEKIEREMAKENQTKAIQQGYKMQTELLSKTISSTWIALMRSMRRVKGKIGSREVFGEARARGKITSDVYVASAQIEHHVYRDVAAAKIFERGAKLFPEDATFILEYLKHLLAINDTTNARVAFETSVSKLTQKPELIPKSRPLYSFFHKYESNYGELSQIRKLEQRMAELFPEDPKLLLFSSRFTADGFDPTAVRLIVSPGTQMQPKRALMQSIEQPASIQNSPRPQYIQEYSPRPQYVLPAATNSPKRPFPNEELENELNRPRKLARGESPLKGAAGRRLDQQKRLQNQGAPQWQSSAPPFVVPRDINILLSIIPRADLYNATKFNAEAMVRLLSQSQIPDYSTWKAVYEPRQQVNQYQQPQRYGTRSTSISQSPSQSHFQPSSIPSSKPDLVRRFPQVYDAPYQVQQSQGNAAPHPFSPALQDHYSQYSSSQPVNSGSGYYDAGRNEEGWHGAGHVNYGTGGEQNIHPSQPPQLLQNSNWYSAGANTSIPGYPSYNR